MITPNAVSQKCRYALRAIFELALRDSIEPVKVQDIASSQAIPQRFLEVILSELKHGGFVESRRGSDGGYILAQPARELTVGEVINFLCGGARVTQQRFERVGDYVFARMWKQVSDAVAEIYNNTTFADLVEQESAERRTYVPNYAI